jgi:prolipoprotein diacylglyceryltransferase
MALAIFGVLWRLRTRIAIPGRLFALYCMFNGVERFFIEKIRVNAEMDFFGMSITQAELISTVTFAAGLVLWFVLGKKRMD